MHHPGGPFATHKVSIPAAGRDRRPQSVCAPTPQWRGVAARWTGRGSIRNVSSQRYGSAAPFADECAAAAVRLAGVARTTPLEPNPRLSDATGAHVWLKREDLQVGRSYKLRGAYNLLAQLGAGGAGGRRGVRERGQPRAGRGVRLPTRSGCAGACTCRAPRPRQKRERIAALGGDEVELIVDGDTYDEAAAAAADRRRAHRRDDGAGVRRPPHDRRAGHRRPRDRSSSSAGRRTSSWCRSAAAGCSPGWRRWLRRAAPGHPRGRGGAGRGGRA